MICLKIGSLHNGLDRLDLWAESDCMAFSKGRWSCMWVITAPWSAVAMGNTG